MADGPSSTIVFDGDSSGAVAALHAVDVEAKRLAATLKETASKMKEGTEVPPTEPSVKRLSNLAEQIKKLSVDATYGANSVQSLEAKIAKLGGDPAQFKPLLDAYGQVRAAKLLADAEFTKSGKIMTEYGMGVKATSAALRQVPAQFTDIIVSLQGGQAPLTVLLQQGGQLKDVFGGVGNAFKALSGYVIGLINPFTATAAVVGTLGYAFIKGAAESEAYNKSLILTGNAAGTTAMRLSDMAQVVAQSTGGTLGAAAGALATLAGSTNIATAQFEKIAAVAVQMEKVTGVAVADTVKQFSELGKDPVAASEKLNTTTHYLTAAVYEQIKALEEQGKFLEAGALAQKTWADAMEGRLPALVENLGYVERAWRGITGAAKGAWDAMANVGRPDSDKSIIDALKAKIADAEKNLAYNPGLYGADLKNMREQLVYLQRMEASKGAMAAYDAARVQRDEASIKISKEAEKYATNAVKMKRAVAQADADFANSNKTDKDIENYGTRLAGIAKAFKDTEGAAKTQKAAITEAAKGLALYNDLMDKGAGLTANFAEQQGQLTAKFAKDGNLEEYRNGMAALIKMQPYMVANLKAEAEAIAAIEKARNSGIQSHASELEKLNEKAQKLEDEVVMYGMSKEAIEELTTARMLDRIEVLRGFDNSAEEIARIEQTIAARKRLAAAGTAKDMKDESAKAADDMLKEQKRAAEESGKYWEDALMRAFESGKGFFQSLWDTIKNTLKTQVLKVTVQGVMGTLGIGASGAAFAGGGGTDIFGLANTASSLSNLYSAGSSIVSIGSQVAAGTMGVANALGTLAANATGTGISGLLATNAAYGTAAAGTAASAAGGLTAGLAAIPGWGWAALGAIAVASMFGGGGETRSGATYDNVGGTVRYQQGPSGGEIAGSDARRLFTVATDSITAALAAVGSQAKLTGFVAGLESSENGKGFDFAGGYIDGVGFGEYSGREGDKNGQFGLKSQSAEQAFANYATQLKQATVQALQAASDVPKTIKDMLSGIDANALTGEAVDTLLGNINAVVGMVNSFNQAVLTLPFENLKNLSFDAAAGLIAFSGGIEALGANLNTYYTNFYSAEEQRLQTIKNINAATAGSGLDAAAATKESFRALVDAQDLATESGQKTYAALMAVAGTFAQVADAATAAADAASKAAQDAAQTASKLMIEVFEALQDNLTDLMDAIASERGSVAAAMLQVSNPGVMTKDAIQRGIAGTALMTPGSGGLSSAQISLGQADTNVAAQAAALAVAKAQSPSSLSVDASRSDLDAARNALASSLTVLDAAKAATAAQQSGIDTYLTIDGGRFAWWVQQAKAGNDLRSTVPNPSAEYYAQSYVFNKDAAMLAQQQAQSVYDAKMASVGTSSSAYDAQMASYGNAAALNASQIAAAQAKLSEATAAQSAAVVAAREAQSAYIASLQNFAIDATKAAAKLGTLREETLKYYEAQKQLADLMLTSAANLRGAADALRQSLLSPAELLAKQTNSFAQNYSMVLETSGATQASYADKLAALLPELANSITAVAQSQTEQVNSQLAAQTLGLEDRSATSAGYTAALTAMQVAAKTQIDAINAQSEASINQYIAQSEAAAAQLEANTPQNYAADTLAMLSQIDAALVVLDASAKSAEMVIADAIAAGADSTANGLRAVIAALTGQSVPAFASGGSFGGGLRLVGEYGPELEVTGPSRIFNANQTSAMLGSSNAEMVQELRALRTEVAGLRAEAAATAGHTSKTARLLDRAMPDGDAMATRVAV